VLRLTEPPAVTVAGRTDAGVHALGQVAHVDIPAGPDVERLARRLNGALRPDVRVGSVRVAPAGFDARFSALCRRYAYRIADPASVPNPLRRWDTLAHPKPLEMGPMRTAAAALLGEHDFAAYCRRREGAGTVRRLLQLDWTRLADGVLVATVEADAFCHSMVRSLVGALLAVGAGRRPPEWPAGVLRAGVRDPGVTVAPAHGLSLVAVRYPPDEDLLARAATTRARRQAENRHDAGPTSAGH